MSRDVTELHRRLRDYLVRGDEITAVRAVSTGHSNETYLLDGLDAVLRLPPSGEPLFTQYSMATQYHLLAVVGGYPTAPPVPAVRHLCLDRDVLGDEFYLMERVPGDIIGEYELADWFAEADETARDALAEQYVSAIAAVNRLPMLEVAGRPQAPADELGGWRAMAERASAHDLVAGFDALLKRDLPITGPPAVVHGDPKLANFLWDKGNLAAVLDWEECYNGEPLRDLGYMLFFFPSEFHPAQPGYDSPGMWSRERVIEAWAAATERDPRGVELYEVAAILEMAAILAHGSWLFDSGKSADQRLQYWGTLVPGLIELAQAMLAAADAAGRKGS